MFFFHLFITSNIPMGVPIEWNVVTVYGAFFLFGHHADVSVLQVLSAPALAAFLFGTLFVVPLLGNLVPSRGRSCRRCATTRGTGDTSVWLFRGDSVRELDALSEVRTAARDQLAKLIPDADSIDGVMSRVPAFRSMHLHGRALQDLVPKAVDDIDAYEWLDGEIVAGLALGWNFGDGHLHDARLLGTIQEQCRFRRASCAASSSRRSQWVDGRSPGRSPTPRAGCSRAGRSRSPRCSIASPGPLRRTTRGEDHLHGGVDGSGVDVADGVRLQRHEALHRGIGSERRRGRIPWKYWRFQ